MTSASADGLGRGDDAQALLLGLRLGLGALVQADADVDARVAQRQRVGVALAAVAEDRDLAALDDGQVGVVVVEQLGHCGFLLGAAGGAAHRTAGGRWVDRWSRDASRADGVRRVRSSARSERSVMERAPRPMAIVPDWTSSLMPNGSSILSMRLQLVGAAGGLDGDGLRGDVHGLGAEQLDDLDDLGAGLVVGAHLHQNQFALDGGGRLQLDDLQHVDQLVELLGDLLQRQVLAR